MPVDEMQDASMTAHHGEVDEEPHRKRRRGMGGELDLHPQAQKGVSRGYMLPCSAITALRQYGPGRYPPRTKLHRPPLRDEDPEMKIEEYPNLTEQERQLVSSDLEDCEEVWIGEISEYILETQKRLKQVDSWFAASVIVSGVLHQPTLHLIFCLLGAVFGYCARNVTSLFG